MEGLEEYPSSRETISVMLLQPKQAPSKSHMQANLQEKENFCNASVVSVHFCNKTQQAKPAPDKQPEHNPKFRAKQEKVQRFPFFQRDRQATQTKAYISSEARKTFAIKNK